MPVDKNQKIQAHPSPPPNTTKPSGPSVPSPLLWLQDARNFGSAPLLGCWLNTFWLRRPPIHTKKIADLPLNTYIYIYMLYCIRSHFASSLFLSLPSPPSLAWFLICTWGFCAWFRSTAPASWGCKEDLYSITLYLFTKFIY